MVVHEMLRIDELDELNALYRLVDRYREQNHTGPFNLSHWDPSAETIEELSKYLRLPLPTSPSPYVYPGDLKYQEAVMDKLGLHPTQGGLTVHAGTTAILFAMWWIKQIQVRSLTIVCPAYFPVFHAAKAMGVRHKIVFMERVDGRWMIPQEKVENRLRKARGAEAIWITNPVYCTGKYLGEPDLRYLQQLLDAGVAVVADECLSSSGHELTRMFGAYPKFLGLYSPHKSVCLNSVKFALLAFDARYQQFFRDWADVLVGGLSSASQIALIHYLGENFEVYKKAFLKNASDAHLSVHQLLRSRGLTVEMDADPIGHFATCYFPWISAGSGNDAEFMKNLMNETGALVIPGLRNHFSAAHGFNFRINLARACPQFYSSFVRVIQYLETLLDQEVDTAN